MGIQRQRLDSTGFEIVTTTGRSFSMTAQQVRTVYQSKSGSRASRISQTITDISNQMVAALGAETIDPNVLLLDFDDTNGIVRRLEWYESQASRDAARSAG